MNSANYTTASWSTYQGVVTANVVSGSNTPAQVAAAVAAITAAQADLVALANLSAYDAALAAVTSTGYTSGSWSTYQSVVADNVVTAQDTQAAVDAATAAITAAQANLVADLTAYNAALAAVNSANYTTASWSTYQGVVTANVVSGSNTPAQVAAAVAAITAAQADLVALANLSAYDAALAAVTSTGYTSGSWSTYQSVVADNVVTAQDTQAAVDAATAAITAAQANLVADLTAYNAALAAVNSANYTTASWSTYQGVVTANVVSGSNTPAQVAAAVAAITAAQADLVALANLSAYDAALAAVTSTGYTSGSWSTYQSVVADNVVTAQDTQAAVDAATAAITAAQANLVADLTAYNAALAAVNSANYTTASWSTYQGVVTANVVSGSNTPAQVAAAVAAITAAQADLVALANLSAYDAALAAVTSTGYTSGSWSTYQSVVADNVVTAQDTQAAVDAATAAITAAQANLVADLTAYNAALAAVNSANYTTASWSTYQGVVTANVVSGSNTPAQVAAAVAAITAAQADLVALANLSAYDAALAAVTSTGYTSGSWSTYQSVVADNVVTAQDTQAAVDAATAAITAAQANLVADLTAYNAALAAVNSANYTTASWSTYQGVVTANVVSGSNTPAQVAAAVAAITAAQADLVALANLSAYDAALAAVTSTGYTSGSWSTYQSVVADNVVTAQDTQAAVDAATAAITAAQANLVADLTAYNAALAAVNSANYTTASWSTYQGVVTANVVSGANTPAQVAAAVAAITAAQADLVALANLSAYDAALAAVTSTGYTSGSWSTYQSVVADNVVTAQDTQAAVDAATAAITAAQANLVADLTAYNAALAAVNSANYTTASWSTYQGVVTANVVSGSNTPAQVAAAVAAITAAQADLVALANLSAYDAALAAVTSTGYTSGSWSTYQSVVADNVVTAQDTQAAVDAATAAITAAQANLVADLTAYNAALAAVNSANYTTASWSTYQGVVTANVVSGANTPAQVAAAVAAITAAQADLVALANLSAYDAALAAVTSTGYTSGSWSTYQSVVADNVVTAQDTQAAVDAATAAITAAQANLVADLTAYNAALAAVNSANYTTASWSTYQGVVTANVVSGSNTPAQVAAAVAAITAAQADLVALANLSAYDAALAAVTSTGYTSGSWSTYQSVVADNVVTAQDTQAAVDAATAAITAAQANLVADLTAYNAALAAVNSANYTTASWSTYQGVVTANVVSGSNTPAQVAAAVAAITAAQADLVALANLSAYDAALAAVTSTGYTSGSWSTYQSVVADNVVTAQDTQAAVDAATAAITAAQANLVADLTAYNAALAAVNSANYTTASWSTYQGVVTANVVSGSNTPAQVAAAVAAITAAQADLVALANLSAYDAALAAVTSTGYTSGSWSTYQSVVADNVVTAQDTQAAVDAATAAITAAQANLVADLTAYNAALAAVNSANYTTASWSTYQGVVTANVVSGSNTPAQVAAAVAAITAAQADLVALANLSAYDAALAAVTSTGYTSGSWSTYQSVVADNVVTAQDTQAAVDAATAAITAAQANLVADLTAYNAALAAVNSANYTTASWSTYQGVVTANVVSGANTPAQVAAAVAAITAAQADLVALANLSAYDAALAAVTSTGYTSGSWSTYQSVVADNVVTAQDTQAAVDAATAAITAAQANLVADLTAYNAALAAVNSANYTTASWSTYQGVVTANVVSGSNTPAQVAAAVAAITAAQADLVALANLSAYDAALAAVTSTGYTSGSWSTYQSVVADNVVTAQDTQAAVDAATAAITAAQANLVALANLTQTIVLEPSSASIGWTGTVTLGSSGFLGSGDVTYVLDSGENGNASDDVCSLNDNVLTAFGAGTCYVYVVISSDSVYESATSLDVEIDFIVVSLSQPIAPTISSGATSVTVTYTPDINAASSTITLYNETTGTSVTVNDTTGSYTFTGLIPSDTYYATITSIGDGVNYTSSSEGAASTSLTLTRVTLATPAAPSLSKSGTSVTVTYTPDINAASSTITLYNVTAGTSVTYADANTGSHTFTGLIPADVYDATITSIGDGTHYASSPVGATSASMTLSSVTLTAPLAPTISSGATSVTVTYTPDINAASSTITLYNETTGTSVTVNDTTGSYTFTGLIPSDTYYATITSIGDGVNYTSSSEGAASTSLTLTRVTLATPAAPSLSKSGTSVTVTYTPDINAASSTITLYNVTAGTSVTYADANTGSHTFTGLIPADVYDATITSIGDGTHYASSPVGATSASMTLSSVTLTAPLAPTISSGAISVTVTYTPDINAASSTITLYNETTGTSVTVNDTTGSYTFTGLIPSDTYYATITSIGDGVNYTSSSEGAASTSLTLTRVTLATPAAPSLSKSGTSVTVTYTPDINAASSTITLYNVTAGTSVTYADANTGSHTFTGLIPADVYDATITSIGDGTHYASSPVGATSASVTLDAVSIPSLGSPAAPTVANGATSVTVTYTPDINAASSTITLYNETTGTSVTVNDTTGSYTFTGLIPSDTYYATITSIGDGVNYTSSSEGAASTSLTLTRVTLATPAAPSLSKSGTSVTVTYTPRHQRRLVNDHPLQRHRWHERHLRRRQHRQPHLHRSHSGRRLRRHDYLNR